MKKLHNYKYFLNFLVLFFCILSVNLIAEQAIVIEKDPIYEDLAKNFSIAQGSSSLEDKVDFFLSFEEKTATEKAALDEFTAKTKLNANQSKPLEQAELEKLKLKILHEKLEEKIAEKVNHASVMYKQFSEKTRFTTDQTPRAVLPPHVLAELKAIKGVDGSGLTNLLNLIFSKKYMHTTAGRVRTAYELANPCSSKYAIEAKQAKIKWLIENPEIFAKLDAILKEIASAESAWTGLWSMQSRSIEKLLLGTSAEQNKELAKFNAADWIYNDKIVKTDFLPPFQNIPLKLLRKFINKTDAGMWLAAMGPGILCSLGAAGLIKTAIINIRGVFHHRHEEERFVAGLCCSLSIVYAVLGVFGAKMFFAGIKGVIDAQAILCKIRKLKDEFDNLAEIVPEEIFPSIVELQNFLDGQDNPTTKDLLTKLDSGTFASTPGWLSHHGKTIRTFLKLEIMRDKFARAMEVVGQLDFYMAAAKIIKSNANKKNGFCFVDIVDNAKPVFDCQGMWDVFIDPEIAIANDLTLGAGSTSANCGALVSGPNYGGKSVFLRGMITSALLAQCIGIAPAKTMRITPFDSFDTYVSVNDDPAAKESLFSAEMARVESMLDAMIIAEKAGKKVFIIGDELLTGTKPKYAQALVRSVLQKLAQHENGIFIFSTHFDEVIKNAPSETNNAFEQLKVCSNVDSEGFYTGPTFKIEPGVSGVDSALFVAARKLKHHQDIVARAKEILKSE